MDKQTLYVMNRVLENTLISVDKKILENKIRNFKNINLALTTEESIGKQIDNVLINNSIFTYKIIYKIFSKGTIFYRVRKLNSNEIPNNLMSIISDFWNPPSEYITKYGRLNKPYESLLYTSFNPYISMQEVRIKKGDSLAIIIYEATSNVKVGCIGEYFDYDKMGIYNEEAIKIHEIYNQFLMDEFSKEVNTGEEYNYIVSEYIAKHYFDVNADGWRYPSMRDKTQHNICFKTENIKNILKLKGTVIGISNEDKTIDASYALSGFDKNGIARYFEPSSNYLRKLFTEK